MHGQYDWMKDPRLDGKTLRVGHRLPRRPVAPLAQLHAPHPHQHRRQGPRHRLRRPAHVRGPAVAARTTWATRSTRRCWRPSSSTASRCTTSRSSGSPPARSRSARSARCSAGDLAARSAGQTLKDYVLFPLLAGPSAPLALAGNATANLARNLWSFTIIFCGHFPDGTQRVHRGGDGDETRGQWYFRQLLGSANLTGGKLFHIMSRQPQPPDRAPPLPRHPRPPLRRDLGRGARDLRALRHAVQHRPAAQAVRQRRAQDRAAGAAGSHPGPGRQQGVRESPPSPTSGRSRQRPDRPILRMI